MKKKKLYTIMLPLFLLTGGCAEAQIKDVGSSEPVSSELAAETAAAAAKTEGPVDEWDLGFGEELARATEELARTTEELARKTEEAARKTEEAAALQKLISIGETSDK